MPKKRPDRRGLPIPGRDGRGRQAAGRAEDRPARARRSSRPQESEGVPRPLGGRAEGRPGGAPGRAQPGASEDKKVFLTFGAPWCGWCHKLEDFLARPEISAILARDFVVLKVNVDRMTSGKDVMKKYRPEKSGGIPWFTVLDAKGEKLATSDLLEGQNIGYPATPKEINAFMSLIEGQARRIEPGQIAKLRKELETAGEKIVAEMKQRAAEAAKKKEKD